MIGKNYSLIIIALLLSVSSAYGECNWYINYEGSINLPFYTAFIHPDEGNLDVFDETTLYSNIILCAKNPDSTSNNIADTDFFCENTNEIRNYVGMNRSKGVFPAYFYPDNVYGKFFSDNDNGGTVFAAAGKNNFTLNLSTHGLCLPGYEGQYYANFHVGRDRNFHYFPVEGYCFLPAHTVDWDNPSGEYCSDECVGTPVDKLDEEGPCCGDDIPVLADEGTDYESGDCGIMSGSYLCMAESNDLDDWEWLYKEDSDRAGDIFKLSPECGEGGMEFVSDSSNFYRCGYGQIAGAVTSGIDFYQDNFKAVVKSGVSHYYACFDSNAQGEKRIVECKSSAGGRISGPGDLSLNPGRSISIGNQIFFCTEHRELDGDVTTWTDDLDILNPLNKDDCINSAEPYPGTSKYGATWTGTKCCGEPEAEDEYYNDPDGFSMEMLGTSGGCWKGDFVRAYDSPLDSDGEKIEGIINHNGNFIACALDENIPEQNSLLELKDYHTQENLITNIPLCSVYSFGEGSEQICRSNLYWDYLNEDEIGDVVSLKTGPDEISSGCCAQSQCWKPEDTDPDGGQREAGCVDDQSQNPGGEIYFGEYRCINGEWNNDFTVKYTWDYDDRGFCPDDSQCLLSVDIEAEENCIDSGEYRDFKYCEDGEWTSRTRMLSLALLEYASSKSLNEYTLFCDSYRNILLHYDYDAGDGFTVSEYIQDSSCGSLPCVNEFCVLSYGDKVAFGTSINNEINDNSKSFLLTLEKSAELCNSVMSGSTFRECGNSDIFYNHDFGIVIMLPEGESIGNVNWISRFTNFILNPLNSIINWLSGDTLENFDFLENSNMFRKLYIAKSGNSEVFAFLEQGKTIWHEDENKETNVNYLGIEYINLEITPCQVIQHYDNSIACESNQLIYSSKNPALLNAWQDLTSKIRIE